MANNKLESELESISHESGIYLFIISPQNYHSSHLLIFSHFAKRLKRNGIYVSLNEPCNFLIPELKQKGIDPEKMHFVDGISQKQGTDLKNCSFLENPGSLTEMSIAITEAMNTGKFDFIFLDSVSTMLIYNDAEVIESFLHFLIGKIRNFGISGVIILLNQGNSKSLVGTISQFCNKVIKE